ncbi:DUF6086 family protein [Nannocystis punicea]|uniref:DUF6086 family protein n=1 Tax=Nannocystis punicea TaxID=2995304 RepID=A0ABY7H1L2_9BACT|nr:DUF6086 family protein [Nannocystis poenicansa]WAS93141.1 DUF6086 family protein [Nannocystis poenicansa]
MGIIFEHNGDAVWEPSQGLGRLFVHQIRGVEKLLGLDSGVGDVINDECQIDPARLKPFVIALDRKLSSGGNETLSSLLGGCFAVAAGLYAACHPRDELDLSRIGAALKHRGELLVSGRTRARAIFADLQIDDEPV